MHDHNVAHLDIKPQNVMVTDDLFVKLIDLGVSRFIDQTGE